MRKWRSPQKKNVKHIPMHTIPSKILLLLLQRTKLMRLRRNVNERTSVKDEIHPDLKTKQKYYCLGQRKKIYVILLCWIDDFKNLNNFYLLWHVIYFFSSILFRYIVLVKGYSSSLDRDYFFLFFMIVIPLYLWYIFVIL